MIEATPNLVDPRISIYFDVKGCDLVRDTETREFKSVVFEKFEVFGVLDLLLGNHVVRNLHVLVRNCEVY